MAFKVEARRVGPLQFWNLRLREHSWSLWKSEDTLELLVVVLEYGGLILFSQVLQLLPFELVYLMVGGLMSQ